MSDAPKNASDFTGSAMPMGNPSYHRRVLHVWTKAVIGIGSCSCESRFRGGRPEVVIFVPDMHP